MLLHEVIVNRRMILWWFVFGLLAIITFGIYVIINWNAAHGNLIMPLDDVYIHFQYAKQLALGLPYQYNTGQPPTSGATSLIYPYLLAIGYKIGFTELWLGLWAMLLGTLALWGMLVGMFRWGQSWGASTTGATFIAFLAGIGCVAWHFMSGMETGWVLCALVWTCVAFAERKLGLFVIFATLLAVTRPEASLMASVASVLMIVRLRHMAWSRLVWLLLPMSAIAFQPALNWLITGSSVATGNQSKSILAMIPSDWGVIMGRVAQNLARMWGEILTGYGQEGWYLPVGLGLIALIGLILLMYQREKRAVAVLLVAWLLIISGAISTLDNAFWHFKRYQMPLVVIAMLLASYALIYAWQNAQVRRLAWGYGLIWGVFGLGISAQFGMFQFYNVGYVWAQPYQMALWLKDNTPADSLIAVHDVGMMRYMGERNTLDMVGLTTPNASAYWRNGVGSVAQLLLREKPDFIASYGKGHGYGLAYLEATHLMQNPLAVFEIDDWQASLNVALASNRQAIYAPNWDELQPQSINDKLAIVAEIDVADLSSEQQTNYSWQSRYTSGFITEVYDLPMPNCTANTACRWLDGGRLINGDETFSLNLVEPAQDLVLRTLVHPVTHGTLDIFVNDQLIATRTIIQQAGTWFWIETTLPASILHSSNIIRIVPHSDGYYMPYHHWVYIAPDTVVTADAIVTYLDNFSLQNYAVSQTNDQLQLDFTWTTQKEVAGDYRFFVHIYGDLSQPPSAQIDQYPLNGTAPFGVWLRGILVDTITLDTSALPNGDYTLMMGFYDPYSGERLLPTASNFEVLDGRVLLQKVIIQHDR
jgi:hypothetical protein